MTVRPRVGLGREGRRRAFRIAAYTLALLGIGLALYSMTRTTSVWWAMSNGITIGICFTNTWWLWWIRRPS